MTKRTDEQMPLSDRPDQPPTDPLPVPPNLPLSTLRGVRCAIAIFLMLLSAYLGSIFLQGPFLFLAVYRPKLFRRIMDWTIGSWFMLTEFIIVRIMQIRVRLFGDPFVDNGPPQRASLLLLNHRTQLDWFFAFGLGTAVQRMKIILKQSLARVPGAGWAMQCGAFIFLRRQLATDRDRIRALIEYLWTAESNCELILFPEGTDLNRRSLARSHEFARLSSLPYTAYTLHPRATGFVYVASLLGPSRLGTIYDVTVAYPDHLPSPELNVLFGQLPEEVHYHVERIPASDLPWSESVDEQTDRLTAWLRKRWEAKESLLTSYYSTPLGQHRGFANEIPVQSRVFRTSPLPSDSVQLTVLGFTNLLFWIGLLLLATYSLFTWSAVRYFALLMHFAFAYFTCCTGGVSLWASRFSPAIPGPSLSG